MLLTDPLWVVSRRGAAAMNSTWFQFWLIKEFICKKVDKELFITSFEFHTCWTFFLEMFELTFRHLVAETQKITSLKVTSFHNSNPLLVQLYSLHSTSPRAESGWRPKMSMCMWKVKFPSHPLIINTASHFPPVPVVTGWIFSDVWPLEPWNNWVDATNTSHLTQPDPHVSRINHK